MHTVESFRNIGPISIVMLWLVGGLIFVKWLPDKGESISRNAAKHRGSFLLMAVAESISLPLSWLFCLFWLAPTFSLSPVFMVSFTLTSLGFLTAAWIPDTVGWRHITHQILAYGAAALMIPGAFILVISHSVASPARIFSALAALYMFIMMGLFFLYPKAKEHHLIFQTAYIMSFHISVLLTAYVR